MCEITEKEIEAARAVLEHRIYDEGGCEAEQVPSMVSEMLEAAARVRAECANNECGEAVIPAPQPSGMVKPLDLSNLLRHAFFEGVMIAGGSQEAAAERWPEYDPETCAAYSRILSALEPAAPEGQQPVAWGEFYGGKVVAVSLHKSHHYTVPLYTRPLEQAREMTEAAFEQMARALVPFAYGAFEQHGTETVPFEPGKPNAHCYNAVRALTAALAQEGK